MLNNQDSNMAANAICHAMEMIQASWQQTASCYEAAHVIYKPRLFQDGDMWCALLGDDIQVGIAAFGKSPQDALHEWDKEFRKPIASAAALIGKEST